MKTISLVNHQVTDRQVIGTRANGSLNPFGIKVEQVEFNTYQRALRNKTSVLILQLIRKLKFVR